MAFECGQALSLGVSGCKQMARLGHHRIGCDVEQFVQLVSWARSTKAGHAHKAAVDNPDLHDFRLEAIRFELTEGIAS